MTIWDKALELLLSRWDLVSANPAVFGAVLLVGGVVGYLVARWHYEGVRKQIDFLKEKISHLEKHQVGPIGIAVPAIATEPALPLTIPLVDAARKAFDATRGTTVAEIALKSDGGTTQSVLYWYSKALAQRASVYGTWAYASEPCEIDLESGSENFLAVIDNDVTVFNGAGSSAGGLHMLVSDLPAAIKDLKKLGKNVAQSPA